MPIPQSSPCGPCLPRTSPLLLEINHYPIMVISCLPFLCSFTTEIRNFKQCSWILPPFFVVCFVCFWLCLQHIEVPGPGIESQWQQLQPLSGSGNYQVLSHFKLHKRAILYVFFLYFCLPCILCSSAMLLSVGLSLVYSFFIAVCIALYGPFFHGWNVVLFPFWGCHNQSSCEHFCTYV